MLPGSLFRISAICIVLMMVFSVFPVATSVNDIENASDFKAKYDDTILTDKGTLKELVSMRTHTTKFYDAGNNEIVARIWLKPVHFEDEYGNLIDYETSINPLRDSDYDLGVEQNTLKMGFNIDYASGKASPVKYERRDGSWLKWKPGNQELLKTSSLTSLYKIPLSRPVTGVVDSSAPYKINYQNTYPGVTETYTVSTGKVKHEYLLEDRGVVEALANSAGINPQFEGLEDYALVFSGTLEFSKGLIPHTSEGPLSAQKGIVRTDSAIVFYGPNEGEIAHYLPAPYAFEANRAFSGVSSFYLLRQVSNFEIELAVLTPLNWLLSNDRQYPVIIDPTDDIYQLQPEPGVGKDTFIAASGTSVLDIYNFGADMDFILTLDGSSQYVRIRPLLEFDLSPLPQDGEVIEGFLKMNFYNDDNSDYSSLSINAYPITRSWLEGTGTWSPFSQTQNGACWLYYDGSNNWNSQGGDHDTSTWGATTITTTGTYSWDITKIFGEWYDGVEPNHGLLLKGMTGSDSVKFFRTSDYSVATERPMLEVKILTDLSPRIINQPKKDITIAEDAPPTYVHLNKIFEDPNGDPLIFSIWLNGWSTGPLDTENISASIEPNGTLMILTKENKHGFDSVWLNANDSKADVSFKFLITLVPVNDPPTLKLITDKKGVQDVWLNFTIRAEEVDTGQEAFLIYGSNVTDMGNMDYSMLTITKNPQNPLKAEVAFLPLNVNVGDFFITFYVRDQLGAESNQSVKFSVKNRNDAPEIVNVLEEGSIVAQPVKNHFLSMVALQDEFLNFTVNVNDPDTETPDGENLEFWSNVSDANFKLDKLTGNISFMPTNSHVGYFYIKINVRDYEGLQDYVDIAIKVRNLPDPPRITGVKIGESIINAVNGKIELEGKFAAYQDLYLNFTVLVSDDDLAVDPKEKMKFYTNKSVDFNLILDQNTGEVVFLPNQEQVGMYFMRITVLDKEDLEDIISIVIHVLDVNDLPPKPDLSVVPIEEGSHTINAIVTSFPVLDPDGDFLSCIWDFGDGTEPEVKIKDNEKWSAQHTYLKSGVYIVTLTLDDGRGGTVSQSKSITVGDIHDVDDTDNPASLGTQMSDEGSTDVVLIIMVLILVIIVIVVAFFIYMRTGRKYEEEEEEEEDLLGDMYIPELGMFGGMSPYLQQPGYGQGYGLYMGYPMNRNMMMYQQSMMMHPGLPAAGMTAATASAYPAGQGPQLALPPAQMNAFCPGCGQKTLQPSTSDPTLYLCTSCGFKSK